MDFSRAIDALDQAQAKVNRHHQSFQRLLAKQHARAFTLEGIVQHLARVDGLRVGSERLERFRLDLARYLSLVRLTVTPLPPSRPLIVRGYGLAAVMKVLSIPP